MPTLDDVSRIATVLPGSVEKPSGGGMAWFVRRKPFAWESMPWPSVTAAVRAIVSAETCIGVRVPSEDDVRALLQGWPDVFVARGVDRPDPGIIVRLASIDPIHLDELVTESWRIQAPKYLVREFDLT